MLLVRNSSSQPKTKDISSQDSDSDTSTNGTGELQDPPARRQPDFPLQFSYGVYEPEIDILGYSIANIHLEIC